MKQVESTGKTIEKAIESGLQQLNTTMENVDIKIISEGGLFSKAKVLITLTEEEKENTKTTDTVVEEKVEEVAEVVEETVETTEQPKVEETIEVTEQSKDVGVVKSKEKVIKESDIDLDKVVEVAEEFLGGLVYILNLQATMEHVTDEKLPQINLTGEDLGVLIGYRGDTLEAIQNLMNVVVQNKTGFKGKVLLDIENYRNRRVQTLCELATRIAKQVVKNKKSFKLEPMNSYERRIIHSHLQNVEHVTTHSEGKEPDRHLIIDYVE